jgi:DNA-directed RNA polymerase subunit RPC12/RpoP/archaellum component FlaC
MTTQEVNGSRLRQAVREFGSLQKAIDSLKTRKKTLEDDISALIKVIEAKEKVRAKYSNELNELDHSLKEHTEKIKEILTNINRYSNQYRLFESFLAMMLTAPHTEKNLEELANTILIWSKVVWRSDTFPEKLRWLFVETVLGKYLHCYRCDRCGLKFIANQEVQNHILGYHCPNCGFTSSVKADDSFLEAMLGSCNNIDTNNPY